MTQRKDDQTPTPPGGRAAERQREFEEARSIRKPRDEVESPRDSGVPPSDSQDPSGDSADKDTKK